MSDDDDGQGGRSRGPRDDVAAELATLRRRLRETDDITRESAGLLSEIAPKIADLEQQAAALAGGGSARVAAQDPALAAVKAALGMCPEPPTPWCWPTLDRDQAAAAWEALARWVGEVLVPTYELTRGDLLDCWPRHPRVVTELSWLRASYLEAHARGAAATQAQDWHLRALPGALTALAAAVPLEVGVAGKSRRLCGPGHHLDRAGIHGDEDEERRQEPALAEHWRVAWRDAMDSDLTQRRGGP